MGQLDEELERRLPRDAERHERRHRVPLTLSFAAMTKRGGIVLADGERAYFVPAEVAQKLVPVPAIARVPGAHADLLGIAQVDGLIVPVVAIGQAERRAMLVVEHVGEPIGLVGADVLASGTFEATADGVRHDGRVAKPLDLGAIYARLQAGARAGRADSRRDPT
jgi:hypothetical protein